MLVRELRPTIMMSAEDYDPPLTSSGEHILKFTSRSGEFIILVCIPDLHSNDCLDADDFLGAMEEAASVI